MNSPLKLPFISVETARKNSNFTLASLRLKIPDTHRQKNPFLKANKRTLSLYKHSLWIAPWSCRSRSRVCLRNAGVVSLAFENGSFCLCVSGILSRNEASVKLLFFLAVSMHGNFFAFCLLKFFSIYIDVIVHMLSMFL